MILGLIKVSDLDLLKFRVEKIEEGMEDLKSEIKESMDDFKSDVREHLKESRENQKVMNETMVILRENLVKQTVLVEQLTTQMNNVTNQVNNVREEMKSDIGALREEITTNSEDQVNWFRGFVDKNVGLILKVFLWLIVLVISGLIGAKVTGFDVSKLFSF